MQIQRARGVCVLESSSLILHCDIVVLVLTVVGIDVRYAHLDESLVDHGSMECSYVEALYYHDFSGILVKH